MYEEMDFGISNIVLN